MRHGQWPHVIGLYRTILPGLTVFAGFEDIRTVDTLFKWLIGANEFIFFLHVTYIDYLL